MIGFNLVFVLFNNCQYQFLLRRILRPPRNPQCSNRMQAVNTKLFWLFKVYERELKQSMKGDSPSGPFGSGLYVWGYLNEIPELLLVAIREYAHVPLSFNHYHLSMRF